MSTHVLIEHFFRHEYGRVVAILSRRFGMRHMSGIEDAVQFALLQALDAWSVRGLPENPAAWVFRVAERELLGEMRRQSARDQTMQCLAAELSDEAIAPLQDEEDAVLHMLYACCHEDLPAQSQLVFALKTVCGFSIHEIALRLFITEANVYKRFTRARTTLADRYNALDQLNADRFVARLPAVQNVVYLLFTEGYLSSHEDYAIRRELCEEALRLGLMLASHRFGGTAETCALLALMYLHVARLPARQDVYGGLVLLEEQDRTLWNAEEIAEGLQWLARSAQGNHLSRYHAEAGIAAEHCLAPSFASTRWHRIVEYYDALEHVSPSATHALNRAVALAEWQGPHAALRSLEASNPPAWLAGSYLWAAVLADLYGRTGSRETAERYAHAAVSAAPNEGIRLLLRRRLASSTKSMRVSG